MIQQLLDATPLNGVCTFPGGTVDILENSTLTVPRAMTIDGNGTTVRVVDSNGNRSTLLPTTALFNFAGLPDGADVTVKNLTIEGPDASSWPVTSAPNTGALDWSKASTWNSSFTVDNCTITGGYCYAVQRAGGGHFRVYNSVLSGFVGALSFFESHGGHGDHICRDSILCAPGNQKNTSIGAYIHPHLHVTWERVHATGWKRYALYLNGTPQSAGHHDLIDVTAENCALIQTGSSSETTLLRCVETGVPANGGSFFKGPVLSVGSTWESRGLIGLLGNNTPSRRFIGDTIRPNNLWMAAGNNSGGTIVLHDCDVQFDGRDTVVSSNTSSTVAIKVVGGKMSGSTTGHSFNVTGGSLRFVDSPTFPNVRAVPPGVLL